MRLKALAAKPRAGQRRAARRRTAGANQRAHCRRRTRGVRKKRRRTPRRA
jgi:hypothetical protein